jgi:hypothetical protein
MTDTTRAYHFVTDTLRDGSPIPPDGEWLKHSGPCAMCESGLHASRHPFDALQYAPGNTLCLVEVRDIVAEQDDKLVCRERMIVKRIDATDLLRYFARQYALDVAHLWDMPAVVRAYLEGDDSLRAAAGAAAGAAWAAAGAAGDAAWVAGDAAGAAWDAAGAAWAAAWAAGDAAGAARAAAWAAGAAAWAAGAAAWAARAAAGAAGAAAWAAAGAARAAAGAAAKQKQRDRFAEFVSKAFA